MFAKRSSYLARMAKVHRTHVVLFARRNIFGRSRDHCGLGNNLSEAFSNLSGYTLARQFVDGGNRYGVNTRTHHSILGWLFRLGRQHQLGLFRQLHLPAIIDIGISPTAMNLIIFGQHVMFHPLIWT